MKAAAYNRYGPPEVVQIKDIETPVPRDDEVLIRVRAASVNPVDWHFMRGTPYVGRIMTGLRKPKVTRLGVDDREMPMMGGAVFKDNCINHFTVGLRKTRLFIAF